MVFTVIVKRVKFKKRVNLKSGGKEMLFPYLLCSLSSASSNVT